MGLSSSTLRKHPLGLAVCVGLVALTVIAMAVLRLAPVLDSPAWAAARLRADLEKDRPMTTAAPAIVALSIGTGQPLLFTTRRRRRWRWAECHQYRAPDATDFLVEPTPAAPGSTVQRLHRPSRRPRQTPNVLFICLLVEHRHQRRWGAAGWALGLLGILCAWWV